MDILFVVYNRMPLLSTYHKTSLRNPGGHPRSWHVSKAASYTHNQMPPVTRRKSLPFQVPHTPKKGRFFQKEARALKRHTFQTTSAIVSKSFSPCQQKLLFVLYPTAACGGATKQRKTFHLPSNLFAAGGGEGPRKQIRRQVEGFPMFGCAAAGGRRIQFE